MKLVILDRDGTINHDSDAYIKSPEEWRPIPGSLEAIARLTQADYRIVVATNQSGIARGLFDTRTLFAIHDTLLRAAAQLGGRIDAFSSVRTPRTPVARVASRSPGCCSRCRGASMSRSMTPTWWATRGATWKAAAPRGACRADRQRRATHDEGNLPTGTRVFQDLAGPPHLAP